MKLNWFTPLLPARSDIAHYTARILPALRDQAEIVLWTQEGKWDAALEKYATIRQYKLPHVPWAELNRADLSFYNLGNNDLFHGSIWQVSRRQPGIVILHDFRMHHFFDSFYRRQRQGIAEYLAQMEIYYGPEGRKAAEKSVKNQASNIDSLAERYPLTPLALENCLGVLVHTREAFAELKRANRWLVGHAALPFPVQRREQHRQRPPRELSRYHLIVFGYLSRNRRLDALFAALAQLREKDRFHLDVYGEIWDERHVRRQIRAFGLQKFITLHGFVPEAELDAALEAADLAINLRYPSVGEASGSQLRIWAHALPSLVTQVGWYASLSDQAVIHVRPEHEIEDIQTHLSAFLADPDRFAEMGERGHRTLAEHHAPETYVQAVLGLATEAQQFRPRAVAYDMAERVGTLMSAWTSPALLDEASRSVAQKIFSLTSGPQERKVW